jgi:hypothetical protein
MRNEQRAWKRNTRKPAAIGQRDSKNVLLSFLRPTLLALRTETL